MSEEKISSEVSEKKGVENNSTISTKLSTEQLICKTPQESSDNSVKSLEKDVKVKKVDRFVGAYNSLLYLGVSQILFGLLMTVFGALVIIHDAKLAQLGGGLWGGCLAVVSGATGILASAKNFCPLRSKAQKIAHTIFLALSLISVAISQLVVVVAATGLARDISHSSDTESDEQKSEVLQANETFPNFPSNYLALLSNAGLLIVSGVQCVCATVASYQSSRILCPCFRSSNENLSKKLHHESKDAFIDSWLGKHTYPPPLYVVTTAPNSTGKRSRLSVAPVLSIPPPPPILSYPLIPAPLGSVPSPLIHPYHREMLPHKRHKRYHTSDHHRRMPTPVRKPRKYKSKSKEKQITTEDVVRTYTGLDRTIAEEFIEICDSRNNSLCSDSSCQSSCHSSGCTCGNTASSS